MSLIETVASLRNIKTRVYVLSNSSNFFTSERKICKFLVFFLRQSCLHFSWYLANGAKHQRICNILLQIVQNKLQRARMISYWIVKNVNIDRWKGKLGRTSPNTGKNIESWLNFLSNWLSSSILLSWIYFLPRRALLAKIFTIVVKLIKRGTCWRRKCLRPPRKLCLQYIRYLLFINDCEKTARYILKWLKRNLNTFKYIDTMVWRFWNSN